MWTQFFEQTISLLAQDKVFWGCALVGTFSFFMGILLTFFGFSLESLDGITFVGDSFAFKWLSLQGIFGFWMLFGWTGLTCKKEFSLSDPSSLGWGLTAGCVALILSGFIFKSMKRLQNQGVCFTLSHCVGKKGFVLQEIHPGGFGKISLSFEGVTYEASATAREKIASFTSVHILAHFEEKYLIVTPCTQENPYGT